jgi:hypothetical protein
MILVLENILNALDCEIGSMKITKTPRRQP